MFLGLGIVVAAGIVAVWFARLAPRDDIVVALLCRLAALVIGIGGTVVGGFVLLFYAYSIGCPPHAWECPF
jgi:hypothetical protein